MTVVLDASALLALLRDEPGADRVRTALAGAAMTTVNLAEVVGHFARNGASLDAIRQVLDPLPVDPVDFDDDLAWEAGMLIQATAPAGLSLGDRACLALARRLRVPAMTADRQWSQIADRTAVTVDIIR